MLIGIITLIVSAVLLTFGAKGMYQTEVNGGDVKDYERTHSFRLARIL